MDVLIAVLVVASTLIFGIAGNLIASELYDRSTSLAKWLIERAVAKLPAKRQARYREEWLSHLDECPGKLTRVCHALGCLRASRKLRTLSQQKSARAHSRGNLALFIFSNLSFSLLHRSPSAWREGMLSVVRRSLKKVKPKGGLSDAEEIARRVAILELIARRTRAARELFKQARRK